MLPMRGPISLPGLVLLTIVVAFLVWGMLRPLSDFVRGKLYNNGYIYDADIRDEILYGRVRPKLFTSEPSAVTFAWSTSRFQSPTSRSYSLSFGAPLRS